MTSLWFVETRFEVSFTSDISTLHKTPFCETVILKYPNCTTLSTNDDFELLHIYQICNGPGYKERDEYLRYVESYTVNTPRFK